jgi:hypothetical protein
MTKVAHGSPSLQQRTTSPSNIENTQDSGVDGPPAERAAPEDDIVTYDPPTTTKPKKSKKSKKQMKSKKGENYKEWYVRFIGLPLHHSC